MGGNKYLQGSDYKTLIGSHEKAPRIRSEFCCGTAADDIGQGRQGQDSSWPKCQDLERDGWYGTAGNLVHFSCKTDDGSTVTYMRN